MKKKSQLYKIKYICYTFIINRIIDTEFYSMKLCYNRTQKRVKCNSKEKKKNVQGMVEEVARVEGRKYEGRAPLVERILSGL